MKKEAHKIVLVIGFIIALIGTYISAIVKEVSLISVISTSVSVTLLLAVPFVFAKNEVVKNIGYFMALFAGAQGVLNLMLLTDLKELTEKQIGGLVVSVGYIVMTVAALMYYVMFIFRFFGFVKVSKASKGDAVIDDINRYGEMKKDGIITDEEFLEIKQNILSGSSKNKKEESSMDDLKKWKKLLDQQIISEAEFTEIKKDFLNKN